jgi:NAD(P)-dependent dehydrogenase (short-subunit alcohol dehydrogenase family)
VADRDAAAAEQVAAEVGGIAVPTDVTDEAAVARLVERAEDEAGPIGLFRSNAGILFIDPDQGNAASDTDGHWQLGWQVHVMAHVYAARALIPRFRARGGGYLLQTVSAAGLLTQSGGGDGARSGGGVLLHPAPPAGAHLPSPEGGGRRPLARRHGEAADGPARRRDVQLNPRAECDVSAPSPSGSGRDQDRNCRTRQVRGAVSGRAG